MWVVVVLAFPPPEARRRRLHQLPSSSWTDGWPRWPPRIALWRSMPISVATAMVADHGRCDDALPRRLVCSDFRRRAGSEGVAHDRSPPRGRPARTGTSLSSTRWMSRRTTSTLDQSLAYDVVFAFSDVPDADMVAMGTSCRCNVMRAGTWCWAPSTGTVYLTGLARRIMNTLDNPFTLTSPIEKTVSLKNGDDDAMHLSCRAAASHGSGSPTGCGHRESGRKGGRQRVWRQRARGLPWIDATGINAFPGTATALSGDPPTLFHNVFSPILAQPNVSASRVADLRQRGRARRTSFVTPREASPRGPLRGISEMEAARPPRTPTTLTRLREPTP